MVRRNFKLGLGIALAGIMMSTGTACSQKDADVINKHTNAAVKELADNQDEASQSEQQTEEQVSVKTIKTTATKADAKSNTKVNSKTNTKAKKQTSKKNNSSDFLNNVKKSLPSHDWLLVNQNYNEHWKNATLEFDKNGNFELFYNGDVEGSETGTYSVNDIKITFKFNNPDIGTLEAPYYTTDNKGNLLKFTINYSSKMQLEFGELPPYLKLKKEFEGTYSFDKYKITISNIDKNNSKCNFNLDMADGSSCKGTVEDEWPKDSKTTDFRTCIFDENNNSKFVTLRFHGTNIVDVELVDNKDGVLKTIINESFIK